MDGILRRRGHRQRRLPNLHPGEPALLAKRSAQHVRRGEHPLQPAGTNRPRSHRGNGVQIPLRHQRRRLRKQNISLPGNQSHPQPRHARTLPRGQDENPRHGSLPALSRGICHRRHIGREEPAYREAGLDPLLRQPAHYRRRNGTRLPRRGTRKAAPRRSPPHRPRRTVRRKILRT